MPKSETKKEIIAVLGYGSQGKAIALNLRDSGYGVVIGLKSRSRGRTAARKDRFTDVLSVSEAVRRADIIIFALPDHAHGRIFKSQVQKGLKPGATLMFLHGFSVHFGFVEPPDYCDVVMVAPHAPGILVREKYLGERSLSAFYAIYQDHTGRARRTAIALASAMGFMKNRLVKTTFAHEAVGDLFGEQAVLCGGLSELIQNGFELLVEKGVPPDNAYLEVAYQLDLIIRLIKQYGIEGMYKRISVTARFGSAKSGKKIIGPEVKKNMRKLYQEIASGKFARQLNRLKDSDIAELDQSIHSRANVAFEKAARKFSK